MDAQPGRDVAMDRLEEAYVRNAPAALRLAYLLTGDREQAQDLVQEAFARVAGTFRHLRSVDDVDAYLRRTVVNLHRSGLRRLRLERSWRASAHVTRVDAVPPPDPADGDLLWRALRSLPDRQRAAIVLRYYEDLSERESAALLGVTKGALNQLVARGMQTLRASIDRGDDG